MNVSPIPIFKQDERGIMYDCGKMKCIQRKAGAVGANHTHERSETLYLVRGEIELTIGKETKKVSAPAKIEIESNVYHKDVALTEIEFIIEE